MSKKRLLIPFLALILVSIFAFYVPKVGATETLIDSETDTSHNGQVACSAVPGASTDLSMFSQAVNVTGAYNISKISFRLKKYGSPTGNAYAKLYAVTGTYGTDALPTGSALATSDAFDISTITTSRAYYNFSFSTSYTMEANTVYALVYENPSSGIDSSNRPETTEQGNVHGGNAGVYREDTDAWSNDYGNVGPGKDINFYLYGTPSNADPTNDACDSSTNFYINTYAWVNMTVTDTDLVADLKEVEIQVNTTGDAETFTLNWTQSTDTFAEVSDSSGICTLDVSTSTRVNLNTTQDKIAFYFKFTSGTKGACDVKAVTTDDSDATDTDTYSSEFTYSNTAPTIGEFYTDQGDDHVYSNQIFVLYAKINDVDHNITANDVDFVNVTIEISGSVILKWDNATNTFSEYSDTNNYCTFSGGSKTALNDTAYRLGFQFKLNAYPHSSVNVVATNTKVFDESTSGSGSESGLFTYGDITYTFTVYTQDWELINDRTITIKGTMGNGTSFEESDTDGSVTVTITYGTTSWRTWWGTYCAEDMDQSKSVSGNGSYPFDSHFKKYSSGSFYLFIAVNATSSITGTYSVEKPGSSTWKIEGYSGGSTSQSIRVDVSNWIMTSEPYSWRVDGNEYTRESRPWTWDSTNHYFDYTMEDWTVSHTVEMSWEEPQGTGSPYTPPSPPPSPPPVIDLPEELEEITEPGNVLTRSPYPGIAILCVTVFGVIAYEQYSKGSRRKLKWNRKKAKKLPRKPKKQPKLPKRRRKNKF